MEVTFERLIHAGESNPNIDAKYSSNFETELKRYTKNYKDFKEGIDHLPVLTVCNTNFFKEKFVQVEEIKAEPNEYTKIRTYGLLGYLSDITDSHATVDFAIFDEEDEMYAETFTPDKYKIGFRTAGVIVDNTYFVYDIEPVLYPIDN